MAKRTPTEDSADIADAAPVNAYPTGPEPVPVTMAHFHTYNSVELVPGDVVWVDPDTAAIWTRAGYVQTLFPDPEPTSELEETA